jgi:uncharacterized protein (TIGR02058 family)
VQSRYGWQWTRHPPRVTCRFSTKLTHDTSPWRKPNDHLQHELATRIGGTNMTKKRMVLEIGMGTDIRGADPTKAACRALRDALWHNSLSIAPALGQSLDAMIVDVHIGVPRPELVDKSQVMAVLPHGSGSVTVVEGGLEIHNDEGTSSTLIANACVVVSLDIA